MEFKSAVVYKDGEEVARCAWGKTIEMDFEGLPHLELFHMPIVKLDRICMFEHMAGKPLGSFFNFAGVDIEGRRVEPVFYVHGRSEAIRGKTTVSTVVLAYPHGDVDLRVFVSKTPQIYKQFTTMI